MKNSTEKMISNKPVTNFIKFAHNLIKFAQEVPDEDWFNAKPDFIPDEDWLNAIHDFIKRMQELFDEE